MKTAMQELIEVMMYEWGEGRGLPDWAEQALEKEKEQSINLIKQTAMFMGASIIDIEISKMEFEDVYNSYFNQNK
jgi:hypothetical protein